MKGYGRVFTIGAISVGIVLFTFFDLRISGGTRASSLYGGRSKFTSLFAVPRAEARATEKEQRRSKKYLEMREKLGDMERKVADMKSSLDQIEKEDDSHISTGKTGGLPDAVRQAETKSAAASGNTDAGSKPAAISHALVPKFPDFKADTKNGSKVPSVLSKQAGHEELPTAARDNAQEGDGDTIEIKVFDSDASFKNHRKALASGMRPSNEGLVQSHIIPLSRIETVFKKMMQNKHDLSPPARMPGGLDVSALESFRIPAPGSSGTRGAARPTPVSEERSGAWHGSAARSLGGGSRGLDADVPPVPESASKMPLALQESPRFEDVARQSKGAPPGKPGSRADRGYGASGTVAVFCEGFGDPEEALKQGKCRLRAKQPDSGPASAEQDGLMRSSAQNGGGEGAGKEPEKRPFGAAEKVDRLEKASAKYLGGNKNPEEETRKVIKRERDSHENSLRRDRRMGEVLKGGRTMQRRVRGAVSDDRMLDKIGKEEEKMDERIDEIMKGDKKINRMLEKKLRDGRSTDGVFGERKEVDGKAGAPPSMAGVLQAKNEPVGSEGGLPNKMTIDRPGTLPSDLFPKGDLGIGKGPKPISLRQTASSTKDDPLFGSEGSREDFDDESAYSSSEFSTASSGAASASRPVLKFLSSAGLSKKGSIKEDLGAGRGGVERSGSLGPDRPVLGTESSVQESAASAKTASAEKMSMN